MSTQVDENQPVVNQPNDTTHVSELTPSTPPSSRTQTQQNPPETHARPQSNVGFLGKVNNTLNQVSPLDSKGFQTNLFGCFESPIKYLVYSLFCPCCVSATTHTLLENRECTIFDCLCFPNAYQTRQSIRKRYNLPFDTGLDCVGTTLCYSCTVHQNVRELERLNGGPMWSNNDENRKLLNGPRQQSMVTTKS